MMLVSLKWLSEYVDVPGDVEAFARRLTMASAEVERVTRVGGDWDPELVRVGRVLSVEAHPRADRLRLATVDDGRGEPLRVICGAPNVREGQLVAFAREGARIIDGRSGEPAVLRRATIRGVESAGMVLSERELGLSDEHEGILELPEEAPVGEPLSDYMGDVVLDVHVWPNRADLMSMVGIAREVAAIEGAALRPPPEEHAEAGAPASEAVSISILDPALCSRYIGAVIEGIRVGPSPRWLQQRLLSAGMRPISNVVDITNYVLMELGQPLHAFDLDRLEERAAGGAPSIEVRPARPGERLLTLDGEERALSPEMLVIADGAGPVALAGVMGGAETEVTESTTRILLEAARFQPASIRRTSVGLGLRSESSIRFERGLSPELCGPGARRAARRLEQVAGGRPRPGALDATPRPPARRPSAASLDRL
ncbi:MAG: phenylalanine--tRNA ligase subunit beta, partial [Chloroflexi bacterium]|nr:phenylalanine--tRNA ligase subunit beta [Chloroflexota bacterium]